MANKIQYLYSHSQTVSGTGYFTCVPEEDYSLEALFKLLQERPQDTFLHQFVLDQILRQNPAELLPYLNQSPIHDIILAEACLISEPVKLLFDDKINLRQANIYAFTPLPLLLDSSPGNKDIFKKILANLNQGLSLVQDLPFYSDIELDAQQLLFTRYAEKIRAESKPASANAPIINNAELLAKIMSKLAAAGLLIGQEMRHEASLSPIALLRKWPLRVESGLHPAYHLTGENTAYGRGLTLAQARISLHMEIIERASAYADFIADGDSGKVKDRDLRLYKASPHELNNKGFPYYHPEIFIDPAKFQDCEFYWVKGQTQAGEIYVPAQSVFLFTNLAETALFDKGGSTGLGAGATPAQAKLAALLEIVERDSQATMPFKMHQCFTIASRDQVLQSLLDDYHLKGIYPFFQHIATEFGIPAYRCLVRDFSGAAVIATASNLSGKKAVLSAMTETAWPYSWATLAGKPSKRPEGPLPQIFLEDLPDLSLNNYQADLEFVENRFTNLGHKIIYVELTRPDLEFPVYRAFIPGLETHNEFEKRLPLRLAARLRNGAING